jgi:hypothetical protein
LIFITSWKSIRIARIDGSVLLWNLQNYSFNGKWCMLDNCIFCRNDCNFHVSFVTVNTEEKLQCCTAKNLLSPKLQPDRTSVGSNKLERLHRSVFTHLKEKFTGKFTPTRLRVESKNEFPYRSAGLALALPLINT